MRKVRRSALQQSTVNEKNVGKRASNLTKWDDRSEWYRSVLEHIPEVVWVSRQGKTVYMSPNVSKILGYEPEEIITQDVFWSIRIHPEDLPLVKRAIEELYATNKRYDIEYRMQRKDGKLIWINERAVSIHETGGIQYTYGLLSDITERKQLEDTLRSTQEQLEHVISLNPAVIFIEKPLSDHSDVTSTFVSESVVSLLGYEAENFLGQSGTKFWSSHVHPDDLRKYREEMSDLWRDGRHTFEFRFMHKDGRYRWLREEQRITRDSQGGVKDIVGYMSDISEMVERAAKLHESEERYRSLVENIPFVVWIHRNKKTVYMSQNVSKVLGYAPEEIITKDNRWKINIHPDDSTKVDATLDNLFAYNRPYDIEYRVQRKDGEWIWLHERAVSNVERDGVRYTYGLFSDVTERKRLEEELRSAREHLEYAVFSNPAVIYVGKPLPDKSDFWATFISKSVGSVLGFEAEQLTGESGARFWETRLPAEDVQKFRAEVPLLWKNGQHAFEYRFLHKDGRYRWIREEQRVIRDEGGNLRDVVGYWIDITEQKKLEEDVRSAREQLEYAVSSNPAAIYIGKPLPDLSDNDASYMSKSIVSLIGYEPEEFIRHPKFWESHIHPDDLPKYRLETPSLWKNGHHSYEYRFRHKNGMYRWIREEANVVYDSKGKPVDVIGYWTDITERKRLEEELLRSQRLAAIGETAAMVGHDLRNPLQGITGATYALKKQLGPNMNWKVEEMLDVISNAVNYSNRIITDLLDYSSELTLDLHETTLRELTKHALALIQVPENVKVVDLTTDEPKLLVDPEMVQRIFVNVIKNSIDAMPDGGQITISDRMENGRVELKFVDTGRGITQEDLKDVWKPFKTTKAKGLGLGLAISKRIVEAHQGSVSMESKLGEGTTITFTFPIKPKE